MEMIKPTGGSWIRSVAALVVGCVAMLAGHTVQAKTLGEQGRWVVPACDPTQVKTIYCGAIVYGNAGGYVVKNQAIEAKSTQPAGATIHPACVGTKVRFDFDTSLGQYNTAVLPANCVYRLKINIAGGRTKTRDLYLTPGCLIKTKTDGTTLQNKWSVKATWIEGKKPAGAPSTPTDAQGNKCGLLGKM